MKSSGSKTLSALSVLMLFASIFFISCGLPKNPFIVETIFVLDSNYTGPIVVDSHNSIDFSINYIDKIYTDNGINLLFCYTASESLSLSSNLHLIDTTIYAQPQKIDINSESFSVYAFHGDSSTYSFPSVSIDTIILSLTENTIAGQFIVSASDDKVYLDLTLGSSLLSQKLFRSNSVGVVNASILLTESFDDFYDTFSGEEYYLHIFGSYYAKEPSEAFHYDNIVADTKVTYLGSVKLP